MDEIESDVQTFEKAVRRLTTYEEMDQLLLHIQQEMEKERKHYDTISQKLRDLDTNHTVIPTTPTDEARLTERDQLSTELIRSQLRFANLCEKNVKCMCLQNPTLKLDATLLSSDNGKPPRKSLSALHRERKQKTGGPEQNGTGAASESAREPSDDSSVYTATKTVQIQLSPAALEGEQTSNNIDRPKYFSSTNNDSISKHTHARQGLNNSISPSGSPKYLGSPILGARSPNRPSSPLSQKAFDRQADYATRQRILDQVRRTRDSPNRSSDGERRPQISPLSPRPVVVTTGGGAPAASTEPGGKALQDVTVSSPAVRQPTPLKSILKTKHGGEERRPTDCSPPTHDTTQDKSQPTHSMEPPADKTTTHALVVGRQQEADDAWRATEQQSAAALGTTSTHNSGDGSGGAPRHAVCPSSASPPSISGSVEQRQSFVIKERTAAPTPPPAQRDKRSPFNNVDSTPERRVERHIESVTLSSVATTVLPQYHQSTYRIPSPVSPAETSPNVKTPTTERDLVPGPSSNDSATSKSAQAPPPAVRISATPPTGNVYTPTSYNTGSEPGTTAKNGTAPRFAANNGGGTGGVVAGTRMPSIPHAANNYTAMNNDATHHDETTVVRDWDPAPLMHHLYKVEYSPRVESKRNRFTNMEGHLDHLPLGVKTAYVEKQWQEHYFRTHEGRLQWFNVPYAEEHPFGDILLAGTEVDGNKEELTFTVHGGRGHARLVLRCPPPHAHLFDKWRAALLSHAASSVVDSYVLPMYPPVPHYTEKVAIVELGSCSIRGGVLTVEPSLPQSFFPSIATVCDNGDIVVGCEALSPAVRHRGQLTRPIQSTEPGREKYTIDLKIVERLFRKVFDDLRIEPQSYKVLLSVPQNVPSSSVGELLGVLLNAVGAKAAAVTRHPSLVLYAYDVTTGVVVDIGRRLNIVPVVDGTPPSTSSAARAAVGARRTCRRRPSASCSACC